MDVFFAIFGVIVGSVPWIFVILGVKNRRYRLQWKSTLAFVMITTFFRLAGLRTVYQFNGETNHALERFAVFLGVVDFPKLVPSFVISAFLDPYGHI